ncbi:MAG: hypothetical protein K2Z80_24695, partial [Xanthobacteraceae bacterium]|nr:hypothetical protein [Xanthobacteraceae bacterium]
MLAVIVGRHIRSEPPLRRLLRRNRLTALRAPALRGGVLGRLLLLSLLLLLLLLLLKPRILPLFALQLAQLTPLRIVQPAFGLQLLNPLLIVRRGGLLLIRRQVLLRILPLVAAKLLQLAALRTGQAIPRLELLQALRVAAGRGPRLAALNPLHVLAFVTPQLAQLALLAAAQPSLRLDLLQALRIAAAGDGARRYGRSRLDAPASVLLDRLLPLLDARGSARRGA